MSLIKRTARNLGSLSFESCVTLRLACVARVHTQTSDLFCCVAVVFTRENSVEASHLVVVSVQMSDLTGQYSNIKYR